MSSDIWREHRERKLEWGFWFRSTKRVVLGSPARFAFCELDVNPRLALFSGGRVTAGSRALSLMFFDCTLQPNYLPGLSDVSFCPSSHFISSGSA